MKYVLATLLTLLALPAFGQPTPVGLWKTVDDTTGREKGLVRIVAENGVLTGQSKAIWIPARRQTGSATCARMSGKANLCSV